MTGTAKDPAAYFPSIEATYGLPVAEWLARIAARPVEPHMKTVAWLKAEHGLGHGHANALVAHARAQKG